ncbi:hypothetical protein Zmor_019508 [Zophobas morio]|uniref:Uncharacterized protein n=1 Tax=Zophobas morio TaxID=2755281 RepID=A0AA38I1M5_9CUCU|nr:hypothetical protein Zmor_019508 [Zophobas morio]
MEDRPKFKNEYSFRIDEVVEDIQESPSESENEYSFKVYGRQKNPFQNKYSFRIDEVVEDIQESPSESKNEYSFRIDWSCGKDRRISLRI